MGFENLRTNKVPAFGGGAAGGEDYAFFVGVCELFFAVFEELGAMIGGLVSICGMRRFIAPCAW